MKNISVVPFVVCITPEDTSAFLTVNYHSPENLFFQHFPKIEEIKNPHKNKSFEEINRLRNGIIVDTLTGVDMVEIVKCGGIFWRFLKDFSVIT